MQQKCSEHSWWYIFNQCLYIFGPFIHVQAMYNLWQYANESQVTECHSGGWGVTYIFENKIDKAKGTVLRIKMVKEKIVWISAADGLLNR